MLRGFCECRRVQFELNGEINDDLVQFQEDVPE